MGIHTTVAVAMLAVALAGCAQTQAQPSAALISLTPNAERWFKIDVKTSPDRGDERRLHGYIESSLPEAANRVQLLAQALDASGNVVGQRVEWLPEMIPALGRAYFEIPRMPPAAGYRVTVWSYDRLKGVG